jgi:hypothetical protein
MTNLNKSTFNEDLKEMGRTRLDYLALKNMGHGILSPDLPCAAKATAEFMSFFFDEGEIKNSELAAYLRSTTQTKEKPNAKNRTNQHTKRNVSRTRKPL